MNLGQPWLGIELKTDPLSPSYLCTMIKQEFHIGDLRIWPNVLLSPMHGVTDQAFRLLCKRMAGGDLGLLVSEFVAVEGVVLDNPRETRLMEFSPEERPFAIQIFGADPVLMGKAALAAEHRGADVLEVNAGCPAPKVVRRGGGSGLLRDLPNLTRILRECKNNLSIPLTLKCRIGWSEDEINVSEVLKIAEGEGVEMLVIHGRTRLQGYKGLADWEEIARVKAQAKIPVVGNGDLKSLADIQNALNLYGLDGVSVGRGAMHNPWIFKQVANAWRGETVCEPSFADLLQLFRDYRELLGECPYELRLLGKMKQIAARVTKAFQGCHQLRHDLLRTDSMALFWDLLASAELAQKAGHGEPIYFNPELLQDLNGKNENSIQEGCDYKR